MSVHSSSALASRFAPCADFDGMEESAHQVQFYRDDAFLLDGVARFIGAGLEAGGATVVIATKSHAELFEERLIARGLDPAPARAEGRYVGLDAAETLSKFMVDGWPDPQRFVDVVGDVIARLGEGQRPVRAFGEMVALLWAEGNGNAAIRLEELWNDLARRRPFSLLCAYPMAAFGKAAHETAFSHVCAAHSRIIPAEAYAALPTADARLQMIARLQQKAEALEAEVAERREVEKALSESLAREQIARAEAEAANRSKDEFLATVSHELRTPLTAMVGWIRLLRSGQLDPARTAHALEVVERNTQAQARLIEDLLDVSRIITGELHLDTRLVELGTVVLRVLESLQPVAAAKAIRLDAALDPSVGPITGDPDRCQQIVWNLVSNAVKYTPNGGRVEVTLDRAGSGTRITVKDTGVGIGADFLPYVFDRFSRAGHGPTRAHAGLGLGLAIVRHLVELHGGTVHADSPGEGRGATFTVVLPVAAADPSKGRLPFPPGSARDGQAGSYRPTLAGVRVLVVDDDRDARDLLTQILEQRGARVDAVGSVGDALAALEHARPDVLVSDIGLADESGYDLIRTIRAWTALADLPAAALTAYAWAEDRERALSAGYQVHLGKPVDPDALTDVVARLAGRMPAAAS